ncbi:hypothetical protein JHK82_033602 [Glycine max]|uniref:Ubiquitin-like protease family profile domain-containing protein n=1 Tax=Glycine soja TaxID=3848 RepID=A0A0B2SMR6_GLYSO|nr:hypothetical protein JHK85_034320 [Glycine max]KAG4985991.1 hypothetical protein JHK86_033682 [Glycine max]KAG5119182.1 hypothetical protein JHK82_033602 [Glycine max]KAG5140175.1 hypothetical protein JHK84_033943 [Glycine max]KHN45744.1 hypothetical protein glysoja_043994 [Glycine soja]
MSRNDNLLGNILEPGTLATLCSVFKAMPDQPAPRWIKPKSHVQSKSYECGYYVMHWMWCIVTGGLKDE